MNYSCCYVLTDNKELRYFNQMMISITSLRYTGYTGSVFVVTDNETILLISQRQSELEELSAEIVVVEVEKGFTVKEKSRYIKTCLRKHIHGDALFVDTDTIFVSCLPERISNDEIAIAYDFNGLNDNASYLSHKEMFDQCGLDYQEYDHVFLNSGVIWMRDTDAVHSAFEKWHLLWIEVLRISGIPNDQVSLNYLWKHNEIIVNRLDDWFNVQIAQNYFSLPILQKSVILHYFNNARNPNAVFLLNDPKMDGMDYRNETIQQIIHDPVSAFSECIWMKKDDVTDEYLKSKAFHFWFFMFRKHKKLFSIFEGFCKLLLKIRSIILPKNIITKARR